jgi:uncharacterized membrane protein (DUF485 family)
MADMKSEKVPFPWLMCLWLLAIGVVIVFALISYFSGWMYAPVE